MATVKVDLTRDWVEVSEAGSTASDDFLLQNTGYSHETVSLTFADTEPGDEGPDFWLRSGEFVIRAGVDGKLWARSITETGQLVVSS